MIGDSVSSLCMVSHPTCRWGNTNGTADIYEFVHEITSPADSCLKVDQGLIFL